MRRIGTTLMGLMLAGAVLLGSGCNKSGKMNDEALLREEAANLRTQLADRNAALEAANADRRDLALQNAELRRQLDEQVAAGVTPTTGFEGISGVTSAYDNGEVTVSIASDVLFDSGKAELKSAAKSSLSQVAGVLNSQYGGFKVRIAGHTDSDPIKKSGWKSNFHLGSERAFAVMDFLKANGIGDNRMHIASYGPNDPAATKAGSRRVEIVVLLDR
ncbi:MAG: OmpA/MotB family protein [Phycisphaerales bacterium]